MPNHRHIQRCLSTEEHGHRVLNIELHYFGCLKVSERLHFYNRLPQESRERLDGEENRIKQLRDMLECQPETKAGGLLKVFIKNMEQWRKVVEMMPVQPRRLLNQPRRKDIDVDSKIKAPMIFFKNSRPYNIPGFENAFPKQKIAISTLLAEDEDSNPLMRSCEDGMIRYFHLPANNMIWIEV